MNITYIEMPISPLLGQIPENETYRTAVPRVGWLAFEFEEPENIEFPNAEFVLGFVDSMGGTHLIKRGPEVYTKAGIFVRS